MGVGPKTENRKIEKKRPSAVIKAILGTVNKQKDRLGVSCSVQQIAAYFFLVGNCGEILFNSEILLASMAQFIINRA